MDTLQRLQAWFERQCDGDWEHHSGISIQSCDNPGWWVKIDLSGTLLEERSFTPVQRGEAKGMESQPPWLSCYVEKGIFNGAGDATALEEILEIFLSWVSDAETQTK